MQLLNLSKKKGKAQLITVCALPAVLKRPWNHSPEFHRPHTSSESHFSDPAGVSAGIEMQIPGGCRGSQTEDVKDVPVR